MGDDSNILDQAIGQIEDETLRARIAREVELLRGSRRFGLVFDRHLPESVRLPEHPIRKGVKVTLGDESVPGSSWRVTGFTEVTRSTAVLDGDGGEVSTDALVVIREFGEPVYPGLRSVERIANGGEDAPWHTVINGENYHVLQALRSTHRGKVDLIYIDPPYNTGNEGWIYNDRYVDTNDRAKSSKWLSFIERRLLIARDLLKPTGVIIVAIGDDEQARLRLLLDQVFGDSNFIANVIWQGGHRNDAKYVATGHDYMLMYAKDEPSLVDAGTRWRERKTGLAEASVAAGQVWRESGGDHVAATKKWRVWMREFKARSGISDGVARYTSLDEKTGEPIYTGQNLSSPNPRPNLQYDLPHPVTGKPVRRHPNGWRYSKEQMVALVEQGRIRFGLDENSGAQGISHLSEFETQIAKSFFSVDRRRSARWLSEILGDKRFPYPKDHEVLMRWIRLAAPADAVVLDFFGGSGTTTEAVLRLNAEDGGTRQSILVTNNEVGATQAKVLRKDGHHPGDLEWEALGVFEHVTRPRVSTIATGKRPDGSTYSDGLAANVEMFDLTYLDPGMVRRGREFEAIAPLLWLEAEATGVRIGQVSDEGWALTSTYGVLFTVDVLVPFATAVAEAAKAEAPPRNVFIVTDSPTEYQHAAERLPIGIETVRLYEDYLSNYTINTDTAARGGVR